MIFHRFINCSRKYMGLTPCLTECFSWASSSINLMRLLDWLVFPFYYHSNHLDCFLWLLRQEYSLVTKKFSCDKKMKSRDRFKFYREDGSSLHDFWGFCFIRDTMFARKLFLSIGSMFLSIDIMGWSSNLSVLIGIVSHSSFHFHNLYYYLRNHPAVT